MLQEWIEIKDFNPNTLDEGTMKEIEIADKKVIVSKFENAIYAFSALCPHAGAPLCHGWLTSRGEVSCPLHSYKFNIKNGRNTSGEGYKLKTYPIEIRAEQVFILL